MKKLLLPLFALATLTAGAQTVGITSGQYDALKANGQLNPKVQYKITDLNSSTLFKYKPTNQKKAMQTRSTCDCLLSLDSTYTVAMPRNDDGSSSIIDLPFTFNFYGTNYDSLYINNNGNISFLAPYITFTANPFPDSSYNMIAPFWGDVDTRDSTSGLVYYKITPHSMIVKWESVGYYAFHTDMVNTFQLIITDGTDPILPPGNNVGFCYGDMQWTTGDASGGMSGFGGAPATVGVNEGDGTHYFQVGTFDHAGGSFDGPYATADGIDFLDNQEVYFNVATTVNIPPVIVNETICDTIDVFTGDTLRAGISTIDFPIMVSTPEIDQIVTVNITCSAPGAMTLTQTQNTDVFKAYDCSVDVSTLPDGYYYVTTAANDNGVPSRTATSTVVIRLYGATTGIKEQKAENALSIYPNPANTYITVKGNENLQRVAVVDILGNVMIQENVQSTMHTLNLSELSNGIYFVRVTEKDGSVQSVKFLKR